MITQEGGETLIGILAGVVGNLRFPVGTVSVVGERISVKGFANEGDEMLGRNLVVKALVGAILVIGGWGAVAGGQGLFAQEKKEKNPLEGKKGKAVGVLVAREKNFIEVKADGEEKGRRYVPHWRGGAPDKGGGLDKKMLEVFAKLNVGDRVEVEWVFEERLRAEKVTVLKKAERKEAPKKDKGK